MQQVQYLTIEKDNTGRRLDNFLIGSYRTLPKSLIYRIIRRGEVRVNKRRIKQDYRLQTGDIVRIPPVRIDTKDTPLLPKWIIEQLRDNILYDHAGILVVNKPSGLAVHSGSGLAYGLIEVMQAIFPDDKINLVHRLDRETSGCLMLTKSMSTLKALHEQFKSQQVNKNYLALLKGRVKKSKRINQPLLSIIRGGERYVQAGAQGKAASTDFEIIAAKKDATLVRAKPLTGRTHQIRAHAAVMGHVLLGDKRYGDKEANQWARTACHLKRLFLHAESINFDHPETGKKVTISAPLDSELTKVLQALELAHKLKSNEPRR